MSVADAAYNVVHDYPGGAAALQVRMGKTNLSGEVNPNVATAKLGIEDAVTVQLMARDYRILYAMAVELGHFPPLAMPDGWDQTVDQPCIRTASEVVKESADVLHTTVESLADNHVSDNDMARFDKEWGELIVKGQALRQQMAALNARHKARAA